MRQLILRSYLSPGDEVVRTAAVRELHRQHPGQYQTDVRTSTPAVWENNPFITPMVTIPQPAAPSAGFTGVYDAWNRLVSLWAGGAVVGLYRFDGFSRRVSRRMSGTLRDIYYTVLWQAIEERLGGATPDRQFVWGLRGTDDLVLRDRGVERLYGIQDPNTNLTAVADATANVQERYGYTPYGLRTALTASFEARALSLFDWETGYAGYRLDAESLLWHVRYRSLDSLLGPWLTRDPIQVGVPQNPYEYARSRPITLVDAMGMQDQRPAPKKDIIPKPEDLMGGYFCVSDTTFLKWWMNQVAYPLRPRIKPEFLKQGCIGVVGTMLGHTETDEFSRQLTHCYRKIADALKKVDQMNTQNECSTDDLTAPCGINITGMPNKARLIFIQFEFEGDIPENGGEFDLSGDKLWALVFVGGDFDFKIWVPIGDEGVTWWFGATHGAGVGGEPMEVCSTNASAFASALRANRKKRQFYCAICEKDWRNELAEGAPDAIR